MNHPLNTLEFKNGDIPVKTEYQRTKKAALILRAINHDLRYKILKLIDESKGICVTQIYKKLKIEQSVASQQLEILRRAGIVNTARDNKTIYYTPDYARLNEVMELVATMVE